MTTYRVLLRLALFTAVVIGGLVTAMYSPITFAQAPTPTLDLGTFEAFPGLEGKEITDFLNSQNTDDRPFTTLLNAIARLVIGAIVALGLITIVVAGYIYMTAGGDAKRLDTAKSMIGAALLGIAIALGTYLILKTINPAILQEPSTEELRQKINKSQSGSSTSAGNRSIAQRVNDSCNTIASNCNTNSGDTSCDAANTNC